MAQKKSAKSTPGVVAKSVGQDHGAWKKALANALVTAKMNVAETDEYVVHSWKCRCTSGLP